jgi:hypothetical protein
MKSRDAADRLKKTMERTQGTSSENSLKTGRLLYAKKDQASSRPQKKPEAEKPWKGSSGFRLEKTPGNE